jgi:hypothetical protein
MQDEEKKEIKEELSLPPSSVRGSANWTDGQQAHGDIKRKDYHTQ